MKAATVYSADKAMYVKISIHAAREGGDGKALFYYDDDLISIHAAREGGDNHITHMMDPTAHFNPRRP